MTFRLATRLFAAAAFVILGACANTAPDEVEEPIVEDRSGGQLASNSTGASNSGLTGSALDDPNSILSQRTIYFDFDSSTVNDAGRPVAEAHALYLAQHPSATVILEGHGDERGTREYNLALGENRANSVRQLITLLGAAPAQVETVSYGEERPVQDGHDEASWDLNRRVEIVYRTQ